MAFFCNISLVRNFLVSVCRSSGANEDFTEEDDMTTGNLGPLMEAHPPESSSDNGEETVSLAAGQKFSTDVQLTFCVMRRSCGLQDTALQEGVRTRLRIIESNGQEISKLFKDLSARLVSVHIERDCFSITFKTAEEIWKFSTYLVLGHVARCLENFLFDQSFWLNEALVDDVEISVTLNQDHLATVYLGLLLQEGTFFAKALCPITNPDDDELCIKKNDLVMVKNVGQDSFWKGMLLSSGRHDLVPVSAMQPLPYPFYQWFLKTYPGSAGSLSSGKCLFDHTIGKGTCVAVVNNNSKGMDELNFNKGEELEIVGFLLSGLEWFVGRCDSSGKTGFVRTIHVKPESFKPLDTHLVFLSEEEKALLTMLDPSSNQCYSTLLNNLSKTDINTVYRLDKFVKSKFPDLKNKSQLEEMSLDGFTESSILERCETTLTEQWPQQIDSKSQCSNKDNTCPTFSFEDTFKEMNELEEDPKFFVDLNTWDTEDSDVFEPILMFLNEDRYVSHYQSLYDISFSFLNSIFYGFSEEGELVQYLENAREWAKKSRMNWALRRICFLLGRLCAKKVKFSQARVYFEESLGVPGYGFADTFLLTALYINLAAIYLKQNMKEKLELILEKANALFLCLPQHLFSSFNEFEVLQLVLRKAIMTSDMHLEARTCFLVVTLFLKLGRTEGALPFVERLQFLSLSISAQTTDSPVDLNWLLSTLYYDKYLPHMSLGSLRLASNQRQSLHATLQKVDRFIQNAIRLNAQWAGDNSPLPAQITIYLKQALSIASQSGDIQAQRDLCLSLVNLYQCYGVFDRAVEYAERAIETGRQINEEEAFKASLLLAWLLISNEQVEKASDILASLLKSLDETDSSTQRGVVHNLLAICLRKENRIKEAAGNLYWALKKSQETGNKRNQALTLANFGYLALSIRAYALAEGYLLKSLQIFSELLNSSTDADHVQACLLLGHCYIDTRRTEDGRLCYETALLIAMSARNLHSQLHAAKSLISFYEKVLPRLGQCIIYYEHCVALSRQLKDKRLEGEILETLSKLYSSLKTETSYRKSLDYTKQSLRISIDLGKKDKKAETWLQAGRIYYMIQENELVEMYLQAAIETAQRTNDSHFVMRMYEEAGDVFYKGHRHRETAIAFYRDGAVPLSRSTGDAESELRLINKLTELETSLKHYDDALQYATLAVRLSVSTGDQMKERIAFHRLASVHYSLQQYEMAENYYLKALSLSPLQCVKEARYFVKVYCRLGDITLHKLEDALDASGYFNLALAAALEELENKEALYIIYIKLAEIHASHVPDKKLHSFFMSNAQALRKEPAPDTDTFC
ncbi:SH3 domain and tetratricopeptide repeat-containing protein 2-like isoform X1 [Polyodon spathula]|uniref:SH3 domain and tetratricopeptide repeat-containing protein 2-like isoform X1 n=2 Tax=Polyodon spathula TaxID=7913 RepID=UPI001B7DD590|nr:SH3 domain and tetratricopeptide repeat-containing protein 2-like isoform X1 [Polyodon spathula]